MDNIIVGIAEGKIAAVDQKLISYALGSCVGICLYDRQKKIAGMAHAILPGKKYATDHSNVYKFADTGVRYLLLEMCRRGADRGRITAKIAGGAKMFETGEHTWQIGAENVKAVKEALREERIRLIAEDTGENYGRTILFSAEDGTLTVSTVRHKKKVL